MGLRAVKASPTSEPRCASCSLCLLSVISQQVPIMRLGRPLCISEHRGTRRQDVQTRIRPDHPELRVIISSSGDGLARYLSYPLQVVRMNTLQKNLAVVG